MKMESEQRGSSPIVQIRENIKAVCGRLAFPVGPKREKHGVNL
jgi:hypothetical protein